jgi:hypothetical protein
MHPYFKHLLEDISEAHSVGQVAENSYNKSFEEKMEDVEKWVEGDLNEHTFGYYCGLRSENFPPPEQLSTEEVELINEAFKHMLSTYNHDISLPENLPAKTAYPILVNTLNEKTFIPKDGFISFDYCSGYPPDCVFKEHCSCLNIWNSLPEKDAGMCDVEENVL